MDASVGILIDTRPVGQGICEMVMVEGGIVVRVRRMVDSLKAGRPLLRVMWCRL
jgi:hypothetical protein